MTSSELITPTARAGAQRARRGEPADGCGASDAAVVLQDLVGRHQQARAMVTDDVVDAFMQQRAMPHLWGP